MLEAAQLIGQLEKDKAMLEKALKFWQGILDQANTEKTAGNERPLTVLIEEHRAAIQARLTAEGKVVPVPTLGAEPGTTPAQFPEPPGTDGNQNQSEPAP